MRKITQGLVISIFCCFSDMNANMYKPKASWRLGWPLRSVGICLQLPNSGACGALNPRLPQPARVGCGWGGCTRPFGFLSHPGSNSLNLLLFCSTSSLVWNCLFGEAFLRGPRLIVQQEDFALSWSALQPPPSQISPEGRRSCLFLFLLFCRATQLSFQISSPYSVPRTL